MATEVAFGADHERTELCPGEMTLGLEVKLKLTTLIVVLTTVLPPAPIAVSL
jgi:hypothetical protein